MAPIVGNGYRGSYRELAGVYSAGRKVRQLTVLDWTSPALGKYW